jgi:hypothetical protein
MPMNYRPGVNGCSLPFPVECSGPDTSGISMPTAVRSETTKKARMSAAMMKVPIRVGRPGKVSILAEPNADGRLIATKRGPRRVSARPPGAEGIIFDAARILKPRRRDASSAHQQKGVRHVEQDRRETEPRIDGRGSVLTRSDIQTQRRHRTLAARCRVRRGASRPRAAVVMAGRRV